MAKYTPFAKVVKKKLVDAEKTQDWLIAEVRARTGMFLDSGYLYKIMLGQRNSPTICKTICDVLDIPEDCYIASST